MKDTCKIIFEVESLNNASPATISRCGHVYFSNSNLNTDMLFKGWCQKKY